MAHAHAHEQHWQGGICDCSGPCCMSFWCPCVVIGKTSERLNDPRNRDPGCCNATCMLYCLLQSLGGWGCFLALAQRGNIRSRYNIKGGCCGDFCVSWCCHCCGILQQAREVEERQSMVVMSGYQQQGPMYAGPR